MFDILVISPYDYALRQKVDDIKLRLFCQEQTNYQLHVIKALPDEVTEKLHGQNYDYAYIDDTYIDDEVAEIRSHITGESHKTIKFF
jgi:hypothetical protein